MKQRLITGLAVFLIVATVLLTKFIAGTNYVVDALLVGLAFAGAYEASKLVRAQNKAHWQILMLVFPFALFAVMLVLMLTKTPVVLGGFLCLALFVLFALVGFLLSSFCRAKTEHEMREKHIRTSFASFAFAKAMNTLVGLIYPTALLLLLVPINHLADFAYIFGEVAYADILSSIMLTFCFFVPFVCDTFAYIIGKTFGGKQLCPTISPKKTISGAIGGSLFTILLAFVVYLVLSSSPALQPVLAAHGISVWLVLAVALIGSVLCQIGDLVESKIKRTAGVKDSGDILPGHGGILDRIDGLLFVIPVIFVATLLIVLL